MPRQPRLVLPDIAVHIVQRGNNRAECFRGDSDYLLYLLHLKELRAKLDCKVHAYCLMGNHVHLLLTPPSMEACTALMRNLGQRYVQHFNKAYDRTGTLWEGRYRSCVAESARYVLACYRYIELNPVRAGMVSHAASYPWSSHRGNIGNLADSLLSPHPEFLALGSTAESRIACYVRLVEETLDATALKDIRAATNGGYPLGSEAFKTDVAGLGHKIAPGRAGRPTKKLADPDPSSLEIGL